jgi:uncharacterized protein YggE
MRYAITLIAVLGLAGAAAADVTVTGEGKIKARPNIATVDVAVVTDASTAADALQANSESMRKLLETLKAFGIDERDIQTVRLNVSPRYSHPKEGEPQLLGYTASHELSVRVRNLGELGKVVDQLVVSGANRVSGVTFGYDNPQELLDQARVKAMEDARRKAELYAKAAGVSLGRVKVISEVQVTPPQLYRMELAAGAKVGDGVPFALGEQEFTAHITVVYAIGERVIVD